jgi:glycosyltransferase involved in cell wall biosynthesis
VIIPTRNRAALLQRALDSVFSQWGLGVEFDLDVIVVDDGSTDSTAAVLAEFTEVRCLRLSSHRGASAARNAGIEASRGTFVCFLDDDDVWLPGRLRLQIPVLERHPEAGAVYSQVLNTYSGETDPSPSRAVSGQIFEPLIVHGTWMCIHAVLIRKEALDKVGYFDETLTTYEDWDLWLRLSFYFPFVFVPGLVAVWLVSPRGLWRSGAREKENTERVVEKALQLLPDSPHSTELKRAARSRLALEYAQTWEEILDALRRYPFLVRYDWARHWVSLWVSKLALKSELPLATLQRFCGQVKEAVNCGGMKNAWGVRQITAKAWTEAAFYLLARPGRKQEAAYAASRAAALAPSLLVQGLGLTILRGAVSICVKSGWRSKRHCQPTKVL